MRLLGCLIRVASGLLLSGAAWGADEVPTQGSLYASRRGDYITYRCGAAQGSLLRCSFRKIEIAKEKPATAAEQAARVAALEDAVNKGQRSDRAACVRMVMMASAIRSGKSPEGVDKDRFKRDFIDISEVEKRDAAEDYDARAKACYHPSPESHANLVRIEEDRKARTCRVYARDFELTLTRGSTSDVWTSSSAPSGPCGETEINVLERAANPAASSFWTFKSRRLVANKTAVMDAFAGKQQLCKDLDEQEHVYVATNSATYRGCEYVKYGSLQQ